MPEAAIRSFFLAGPAGRLEALLNTGAADATHAALVCHPHPLYGGTMHNKVVYQAMKALHGCGWPVLRFNFRGAGLSAGEHDEGRGEIGDVRAALAWLQQEYRLPIVFAGFSFGAATGLRAACPEAGVSALIALGTPVGAAEQEYGYGFLAGCTKPKLFVSGSRDQYARAETLQAMVASAAEPKKLVLIAGADHFFAGHLRAMQAAIAEWLRSLPPPR